MAKHDSYYQGARPELMPFIPEHYAKVLEIGCGNGGFRRLLNKPCEYWGVEPEQAAAAAAEQIMDKVLQGLFEEVCDQLPDHSFDLVICNDVIEHFADHERFLLDIQNKLTPGGYIIGSIPNVRYYKNLFSLLIMKDWRYRAKGILDSTHLRFFTKKSLRRTFRDTGFHVEMLRGISSAVYLKRKYCTSFLKTTASVMKFVFRFCCFQAFDLLTLYHSSDIKYAQFGFCVRLKDSSGSHI